MCELTDWIPCTIPPVRAGDYDVQRRNMDGSIKDERRCKWSRKRGRFEHNMGWPIAIIDTQDYWRGLTQRSES